MSLLAAWLGRRGILAGNVALAGVRWAGLWRRWSRRPRVGRDLYPRETWKNTYRIKNPTMPPASMDRRARRAGPFYPSVRTPDGHTIKSSFFMESEACERCHEDIYNQWYSSAHHFSSFNNQWYRKSIEYMQDVDRHEAVEVVRRLPRPGGAVQRHDGHAHQADRRTARSAGRARLHGVPLDRRRWTARWARAASRWSIRRSRAGGEREARHALAARLHHEAEPRAAPARVPEAVHEGADGRVLLVVPQGAPRRAGERLPLDSRLQRVRQLAGQRRLGHGRALVLLPAEAAAVRGLPHAEVRVERHRQQARASSTRTASPPPTRRCRRRTRTPSSWRRPRSS